jgi:uracil-DNA glycosylase family 4
VDARETHRRYLEQRRELGESELVLDSLSVEEALRMLGAVNLGSTPRRPESAPESRAQTRPAERPVTPSARIEPADAEGRSHPAEPSDGDWRAAIRAAGGEPSAPAAPEGDTKPESHPMARRAKSAMPPVDATVAAHVPSTQGAATPASDAPTEQVDSPLSDIPGGLVVGGASRALFDDPAFKLNSLEEIAVVIGSCTRCPLHATAINPVPGSGNPHADFMIVGEAPGANEDEAGVPFVGASGQLLTKIIGAIGLTRDDVFIANVLKHRPPGNRNPAPAEVTACSPYLIRQIELVKPKVILALGTFAAQTLLETKTTIGKLRGQIHRYYGVPLIVTYHPAALLRNPTWKRPTWEDVQLARRILDRANAPRP